MVEYIDLHIHTIIEYILVNKVNLGYKQLIILIKHKNALIQRQINDFKNLSNIPIEKQYTAYRVLS